MRPSHRVAVGTLIVARLGASGITGHVQALQTFPVKAVRLVVPFGSAVLLMSALPFLKEGKLLALGVNTPHPLLRDVATISDMLPSFEDGGSYVLLAPADTPQPILNLIANDVTRILIVGRKTEHAGGGSGVRSQADGGNTMRSYALNLNHLPNSSGQPASKLNDEPVRMATPIAVHRGNLILVRPAIHGSSPHGHLHH